MTLFDFFNQYVRVVFVDGEEMVGYVETYTSAVDSEDGQEAIAIRPDDSDILIGITRNEIKNIEVIQ